MAETTTAKALAFAILRRAEHFPWRMQDIGLMALRLDERREYRLHVWNPASRSGDVPIHDHPYDFTSEVIVGELTNTRYVEDPSGDEFTRLRYFPPDEEHLRADTVKLAGAAETIVEGDQYRQLARELHTSGQQPGTVTLLRCCWGSARELTVCLRDAASWRSGEARDATPKEIRSFAAAALDRFSSEGSRPPRQLT